MQFGSIEPDHPDPLGAAPQRVPVHRLAPDLGSGGGDGGNKSEGKSGQCEAKHRPGIGGPRRRVTRGTPLRLLVLNRGSAEAWHPPTIATQPTRACAPSGSRRHMAV